MKIKREMLGRGLPAAEGLRFGIFRGAAGQEPGKEVVLREAPGRARQARQDIPSRRLHVRSGVSGADWMLPGTAPWGSESHRARRRTSSRTPGKGRCWEVTAHHPPRRALQKARHLNNKKVNDG